MLSRLTPVALVALALAACGGSTPHAQGPTAASVSVQPSDLPSGMTKCALTGDINTFLGDIKTSDPATYQTISSNWKSYQKGGATAAYVAFYTDSADHCSALKNPNVDFGSLPYRVAINFVVQYKDSKSASAAYANGDAFEFSPSQLLGQAAIHGTQTGLSENSVTLFASYPPLSYFIAVWQNKVFMVVLAVINMDAVQSKHVALAENSRIK